MNDFRKRLIEARLSAVHQWIVAPCRPRPHRPPSTPLSPLLGRELLKEAHPHICFSMFVSAHLESPAASSPLSTHFSPPTLNLTPSSFFSAPLVKVSSDFPGEGKEKGRGTERELHMIPWLCKILTTGVQGGVPEPEEGSRGV